MKTREQFKEALIYLLETKQLKKLVLSRPEDKSVLRSEGHLFEKKGVCHLQIETFHTDGKATHVNYPIEAPEEQSACADAILSQLKASDETSACFAQINLISPLGDGEMRLSKGGKWLVSGKLRIRDAQSEPLPAPSVAGHNHEKQYLLEEGVPYPFLIRLGICAPDGRLFDKKRAKFLQINKFLENVALIYPHLPSEGVLHVLDLCCGKSYLTFAVYHYLTVMMGREVEMLGVDLKSDVIAYCSETAARLGYHSLHFLCRDIGELKVEDRPDLVLSLHACDIATDIVLAKAIATQARVILSTPCCHHQIMGQLTETPSPLTEALSPICDHSLLRQKLADAITDGLRCSMLKARGYDVTVTELIDPEQTPKNLLIRAISRPGASAKQRAEAREAFDRLCAFGKLEPYLTRILEVYEGSDKED